jgi:hypothetical protein
VLVAIQREAAMLNNQAQSCEVVGLLGNGSKDNTAAATGTGVDISKYEGDLMVTQTVGAITGTIDGKLQACSAADGSDAADITGAVFTQVTTSNDDPNLQKITLPAGSLPAGKPYLRYLGTVGTGPSVVAVVLHATPKYAG